MRRRAGLATAAAALAAATMLAVASGVGRSTPGAGTSAPIATPPAADAARTLALQADGRMVAAGRSNYGFALARYRRDGTLDRGFGLGGRVVTARWADFAWVNGATHQDDGSIVVAGGTFNPHSAEFIVARYSPAGGLDRTFGDGGTVSTNFGGMFDEATAVALQQDGRIVAVGESSAQAWDESWVTDFVLARYLPNGKLDPSFGSGGEVFTHFGPEKADEAKAAVIQGDGKIVVAGATDIINEWEPDLQGPADFAVARYLPDGSLDPGFGVGGKAETAFASGTRDQAFAAAVQRDGRIVVAGRSAASKKGPVSFAVARYLPDGRLDPSFGDGGKVLTALGATTFNNAYAVGLQVDGNIVVAGHTGPSAKGPFDFALVRYLPDGRLDASFGDDGKVVTGFGAKRSDAATALAIQPDGRITAAGATSRSANTFGDFAIARYLANGRLDSSFGRDGRVTTDFSPAYTRLRSLDARRTKNGVLVRWRTGWEVGARGFNLYRDRPGRNRVRLNARLIAARGSATRGARYSALDARAPKATAQYWLQEVKRNGDSAWYGLTFKD